MHEVASTPDVVRAINDAHGTDFTLVGKLPGGYQEGAYEIASADGRAVLKWSTRPTPLARLAEAAELVSMARRVGWPTPEWILFGVTEAGAEYVVQEFVEGVHYARLDEVALDALLAVNDLQRGLDLPTAQNWSTYARDVVFRGEHGMMSRVVEFSPEGKEFGDAVIALCGSDGAVDLPDDDMVCGVFALENVLFRDGEVAAVIDVAALGRGCRAFDLAVLYSRGGGMPQWQLVEPRLRGAAEQIAGREAFNVCLAAEFLGMLAFGVEHWPGDFPAVASAWARRLRSLV